MVSFQKQPPEVFYEKGVLRNFTKFTGKHLCQRLFFNKVAGLKFCKISKNNFFTEHLSTTASIFLVISLCNNVKYVSDIIRIELLIRLELYFKTRITNPTFLFTVFFEKLLLQPICEA